jgi:ribosomal protein S15P/S13E
MGENITTRSRHRGGLRMKDEKARALIDEEFRILEHKIKVFQEHVKGFQKDVEAKLKQDR